MTRNRGWTLLAFAGLALLAGTHFGLRALGAGEQVLIYAGIICMIVICFFVGVIDVYYGDEEEDEAGDGSRLH